MCENLLPQTAGSGSGSPRGPCGNLQPPPGTVKSDSRQLGAWRRLVRLADGTAAPGGTRSQRAHPPPTDLRMRWARLREKAERRTQREGCGASGRRGLRHPRAAGAAVRGTRFTLNAQESTSAPGAVSDSSGCFLHSGLGTSQGRGCFLLSLRLPDTYRSPWELLEHDAPGPAPNKDVISCGVAQEAWLSEVASNVQV